MWFHIPQLICPLKGASNRERGALTEEQALQIAHKLQRTAAADESHSSWECLVPFLWGFRSHLRTFTSFHARRANSCPSYCAASGWWDRTESTMDPSSHACYKKHCPGLGCGVKSTVKLLWAKLPASVWEDHGTWSRLLLKRSKLPHRVQLECAKAGHLKAAFGPILCASGPWDYLPSGGFVTFGVSESSLRYWEWFIQGTAQMDAVSKVKSVWFLLSFLKCKQCTFLRQISILRRIAAPNLCLRLSICIIFR